MGPASYATKLSVLTGAATKKRGCKRSKRSSRVSRAKASLQARYRQLLMNFYHLLHFNQRINLVMAKTMEH